MVAMVAIGLFGPAAFLWLGATAPNAGGSVVAFTAAALLALYGIRGALAGVQLDEAGVTLRGIWRTRVVRWDDVGEFSFGATGLLPAVAILRLRDGGQMAIPAIATGRVATRRAHANVQALIDGLNDEVTKHRGNAATAGH